MANPIPVRTADMMDGSAFMKDVKSLGKADREERAALEFMKGNVPDFMRPENWKEVTIETKIGNQTIQATVRVCPDYLAIGSNTDFVRIPMSPIVAQRIADRFGFSLPTQRIVDAIEIESRKQGGYTQFIAAPTIAKAEKIKNWDPNKPDGVLMMSARFAEKHNSLINEALAGTPAGAIHAGMKKDVVYDSRTNDPVYHSTKEVGEDGAEVVKTVKIADRGVAIYLKGTQPEAIPHEETYSDYSHGIRFVDSDVKLTMIYSDGSRREVTRSLRDIINDRKLYKLFAPAPYDINQMYRGTAKKVVPVKTGAIDMSELPVKQPRQRQTEPQKLA